MDAETVLTAGSVLVALIAVGVAKSARDEAVKANVSARGANEIARKANDLSNESNGVAKESNAIARDAAAAARAAPVEVAWDEAVAAVQALMNANPADPREPVGALLTGLRTRVMLLIDRLDWDGFDDWIAHEHRRGVLLMREADQNGLKTGPLSVEQILEVNHEFTLWVVGYTGNLRRFRKTGPDAKKFEQLTKKARAGWKAVCSRNGWPEEPEKIVGLVPLEDDDEAPESTEP